MLFDPGVSWYFYSGKAHGRLSVCLLTGLARLERVTIECRRVVGSILGTGGFYHDFMEKGCPVTLDLIDQSSRQ